MSLKQLYQEMEEQPTPKIGTVPLSDTIANVQHYVAQNYRELLSANDTENREQLLRLIQHFLFEQNLTLDDRQIATIYDELSNFGFITEYLSNPDVEEININSWEKIVVTYADSRKESLHPFDNPQHALNIIRRLLQRSGITLDAAQPVVRGHLNQRIRVTAFCHGHPGIIDTERGVACSIRLINPRELRFEDFIRNGTGTEPMLNFLKDLYIFGTSLVVSGSTGSGKTTLMGWIMSELPDTARLITIEEETREFNLERKDKDGKVCNDVLHLTTKSGIDGGADIDQQMLLAAALTSHPSHICVAEMKNAEADAAQEAARTGHAVITTVHAGSCAAIPRRILTLCKMGKIGSNINDEHLLMEMISEAFPILCHMQQMENGMRRIVEIAELMDGQVHPLFRYNEHSDGPQQLAGFHRLHGISRTLYNRLRDAGMPEDIAQQYMDWEGSQ